MFDVLTQGLERRSERLYLAVCVGLCTTYVALFTYLSLASVRVDKAFFTRREQVLLQQSRESPMSFEQPAAIIDTGKAVARIALLSGWSAVEPAGVWTDGRQAEFAFGLPHARPAGSIAMQLSSTIMLAPDGRQIVGLELNNRRIGQWQLTTTKALLCAVLPKPIETDGAVVRARLTIATPQRPAGWDHRTLGIRLEKLELSVADKCPAEAVVVSGLAGPT